LAKRKVTKEKATPFAGLRLPFANSLKPTGCGSSEGTKAISILAHLLIHEMSATKRLPYRLAACILSTKGVWLINILEQADTYKGIFNQPLENSDLSYEMAAFLHFHATCGLCGRKISRDLTPCSCGGATPPVHLRVAIQEDLYDKFSTVRQREVSRAKWLIRKRRLEANGGAHTQQEVLELLEVQQGRCYYCGISLVDGRSRAKYHVDHYISVINGGGNDVANIVLSCPDCNLDKRDLNGDDFQRDIRPNSKNPTDLVLLEIRKSREDFLSRIKSK
jgi:5-methylcytosine-specific restriction endonuclease McrA